VSSVLPADRPSGEGIATVVVPRCPLCGGRGPVVYTGVRDRLHAVPGLWSHRRCERCGSLWLDPRPADADLGRCYPDAYFTHEGGDEADLARRLDGIKGLVRRHVLATRFGYRFAEGPAGPSVLGWLVSLLPTVRERAAHSLGPLFLPRPAGRRLLDVGCGNGFYLAVMRAYGWEVMGQEVDPAAAEAARRAYGVEVTVEPLGELARRRPEFDVVTASHVLEHVPDPPRFLAAATGCLRPGGLLVVVTPNASSLGHRVFRADWYALDAPRHLLVSTAAGLAAAARTTPCLEDVEIRSLARKAPKTWRLAADVRRSGRYKSGQPIPRSQRVAARAFGAVEALATRAWPVGEELVLTARRPA